MLLGNFGSSSHLKLEAMPLSDSIIQVEFVSIANDIEEQIIMGIK